jgi:hypothetical protein
MISVTKMWARSFDLAHLDIFWEIAPVKAPAGEAPHEIFDYDFYIFRSEAALGPYEQIGGPLRDTYHFRDIQISLLHKWRQYFYKIKVVHRPTGKEKEFDPIGTDEPEPDLIAAEVIRQEDVLFREFVGRRCWLYPVRTFGPVCTCFDPHMGRKTRSNHLACFGTGWLGGYLSPVEVFVQIDPDPKDNQLSSLGETHVSDTTARMISFPPVNPRDILVESENRRWRVVSVGGTQRLRTTVRQELKLHEVPRGDIEYALPIKVNAREVQPAAERNFTNPQNLENDGDYSDIFAVFGHPRGSVR